MDTQARSIGSGVSFGVWRAFWIGVYVLLIVAPLIIIMLGFKPVEREPLRELSVMLGFLGLSLMGLQFVPTARLPFLTDVFDLDWLYAAHHDVSLAAFFMTLAHPVLLFINNPYTLRLLNVFAAPRRAQAAVLATLVMIILAVSSVWRKQLEIEYDHWHILHDLAAVLIIIPALYHILNVNYYTAVPAQRVLWIVLAIVWLLMIAYTRLVRPSVVARHPYTVVDVVREYGDALTLVVEPRGHPGFKFTPGQFAWLFIQESPFSIYHHPFSIASSAERPDQLRFMIKVVGDWTARVKDVAVGTQIYVDGPYGIFGPDQYEAPGYVFIAGGSGVAPVMSMLETLADRGDQRPLQFFYGNWDWDTVIYRDQLGALEDRLNLDLVHVLESPADSWKGETGFVTREILNQRLSPSRKDYAYFVCGPLLMIDSVEHALLKLGIPRNRIHAEKYEMA